VYLPDIKMQNVRFDIRKITENRHYKLYNLDHAAIHSFTDSLTDGLIEIHIST